MRIAWVTRSFLDYRIPVFRALDDLVEGDMTLSFSGDYVPESVTAKAVEALGDRAFPLTGETKIGGEDQYHMANRNLSFRWQPGLGKHILAQKPDVIVCDGFFKWTLPALMVRLRYGIPLVILYERTHHTERNAQRVRTWYRRLALRITDAMGCSGRLCQEYSEYLGMSGDRITLGHMSADTAGLKAGVDQVSTAEKAALRDRYGLRGQVFLYVGRLDDRKGMTEMWAAWRASGLGDAASLLVVGDGPLRDTLAAEAAQMDNVVMAGRIPYDDLVPFYATADAFVIATLEDNWSLVVPEAMAAGLPILCSTYNGCWPELVRADQNGWTFLPEDTAGFAETFRAATARGSEGLAQMGQRSREIVGDFGPENAARSVVEACRLALAHRGRG